MPSPELPGGGRQTSHVIANEGLASWAGAMLALQTQLWKAREAVEPAGGIVGCLCTEERQIWVQVLPPIMNAFCGSGEAACLSRGEQLGPNQCSLP